MLKETSTGKPREQGLVKPSPVQVPGPSANGSDSLYPSGPHTLHYFYTGVSEPGPRLPQFIAAGYVDGQLIIDYTTKTKNAEPRTEWMARNLDPTYWDQETRIFQVNKARFRDAVETLRNRYNQSKGFHTWQFMAGCELLDGRSTGGYWQYGYDGRDFISLDKETLTWTAADTGAQVTKGKWEADRSLAEYGKWYLEQNCVEELRKYLEYGKETLQRKETPEVKVLAKAAPEGPTTLSCRAHGFYPRNIAVTWVKDGETRDQETQRGGIVPNEDGTYYTWAATEVDPKETDLYTCRVEHESLRKPRDFFWVKDSECRCVCCVSGGEEKEATPGKGTVPKRYPTPHCPASTIADQSGLWEPFPLPASGVLPHCNA
uniref:Ig-like domain-containing protein n=1 Tax=Gopherus evgoodei TaxID=1825980 RepID=A0A8C4YSA2_9SAUR